MNLLKKALYATFLAVIISSTFQCASPKVNSVSKEIPEITVKDPIVFQEWYAGIKVGGTGINLFVPSTLIQNNMELDSVYFRNMKGKLIKGERNYSVVLVNDSPYYQPNPSNETTNPFNLTGNECIIAYKENGETKYLKVSKINERAGAYYENGPPLMQNFSSKSVLATLDED